MNLICLQSHSNRSSAPPSDESHSGTKYKMNAILRPSSSSS